MIFIIYSERAYDIITIFKPINILLKPYFTGVPGLLVGLGPAPQSPWLLHIGAGRTPWNTWVSGRGPGLEPVRRLGPSEPDYAASDRKRVVYTVSGPTSVVREPLRGPRLLILGPKP